MLDSMRKPVFLVALIAIGLTVLVELSSIGFIKNVSSTAGAAAGSLNVSITGQAIPAMALLDGLIFYAILVIGIALLIPERVQSKVQGIATIIVSVLLLLAIPFGTIVYFILWGSFDTGTATAALSLIMFLKIVFAVCLVGSQQRFLENKGLVLIILTSFAANLIVAFLYGLVPNFLVHITDEVAALIVLVLAAVWIVIYLIGGIISVVKVIV